MPSEPQRRRRILVVDDDALIRFYLKEIVRSLDAEVIGDADSGSEAIDLALALQPDVILMDVRLGGSPDGIDAAKAIQASWPAAVIFITGSADPETFERAAKANPLAVLTKPILPEALRHALQRLHNA